MSIFDNKAFLMIGSMKSGTTSLFEDITKHSKIFMPSIKEPGDLCSDDVLSDKGKANYKRVFNGAELDQWIGEATPRYTRFPIIEGVPSRAKEIFGPDLKLIFIGRDPVERLKSHYRHEVQKGTLVSSLSDAIGDQEVLTYVSMYDLQLQQWLKEFPREQLLVLHMEDYAKNPTEVVHRIWSFLGLDREEMSHGVVSNVSAGKREPLGLMRSIIRSRAYGLYVKKLFPKNIRKSLRKILVPQRVVEFDEALSDAQLQDLKIKLVEATTHFNTLAEEDRKQ